MNNEHKIFYTAVAVTLLSSLAGIFLQGVPSLVANFLSMFGCGVQLYYLGKLSGRRAEQRYLMGVMDEWIAAMEKAKKKQEKKKEAASKK